MEQSPLLFGDVILSEWVVAVLEVLGGGKLVELARRPVSSFSFLFIGDSFL